MQANPDFLENVACEQMGDYVEEQIDDCPDQEAVDACLSGVKKMKVDDNDDFDESKCDYEDDEKSKMEKNFTPDLCDALDRVNISDRNAIYILSQVPMLKNLNIKLSRSTLRRRRIQNRSRKLQKIREDFRPITPLVIHWDAKMMPHYGTLENVHRLAINVTGFKIDQLLGVACNENGCGETEADAVYEEIESWKIKDKVVAMCFDTTASNSGFSFSFC